MSVSPVSSRKKRVSCVVFFQVVLLIVAAFHGSLARADGTVVFHLNFNEFKDISGNNLPIEVGEAVTLVPGGGPLLGAGTQLDSANWAGEEDETNQIVILDSVLLDEVAAGAGSIVTWVKPLDEEEWNNIAKTPCPDGVEPCDAFSQFVGIEFQASGPHAGVFGAAQGWDTNVFGPNSPPPFGAGDGTSDTPTDEWTHTALVWNEDGDHTIFVNGEPGDTVFGVGLDDFGLNEPENWTIGGDGLGTGGNNPDATRHLSGELADFAIFQGALTENEINEIINIGVTTDAAPSLQAGDSDQDLDFDQLDLVRVQISAKYLSGLAATWGEGDWNGAPGGSQGSPPAGDGSFNQIDIISALGPGHYLTGPYATLSPKPGHENDDQTSLVYDPTSGDLSVIPPSGKELTSINISSAGSRIIGDKPAVLDGAFDNFAADNVFKATFGGSFGSISFGPILEAGLSRDDVVADLTVVGSLSGGGDLGDVDLIYVPESSTLVMLVLTMLVALAPTRRSVR